ncbi:MAG: hypothetical protein L3J93_02910 [Thermoplasmata archaeon]|nr:hypothetical protein [Thermoplasmata archaeon]
MRRSGMRTLSIGAATVILVVLVLWGFPAGMAGFAPHASAGPSTSHGANLAGPNAHLRAAATPPNGCDLWGPVPNAGCNVATAGTYHYNGGASSGTTLTLSTASTWVGHSVTATGAGYTAGTGIGIFWNATLFPTYPMWLATCAVTAGGAIGSGCTFNVPSAPAGSNPVTADDGIGAYATAAFTVTSALYLTPSSGHVGSAVSAWGYGFGASLATLHVTWTSPATSLCTAVATGAHGAGGACAFSVPPGASLGPNTLAATDGTHAAANSPVFTIVPPSVALASPSGAVGSTDTATGTNWTSSTPALDHYVTLSMGPTGIVLCSVAIDASGNFSCPVTIPAAVHGSHALTATDAYGGSATTTFFVNASASLSPTSGFSGSTATLSGWGFDGLSSITPTWSPVPTTLCTVNSTNVGSFSCSITIPAGAQAAHSILVKDAAGNNATVSFGLSPTVAIGFTNTFGLYMMTPLTLSWTITTSATISTSTTTMWVLVRDLGSSACAAPPCNVLNLSLSGMIVTGQTGYSVTLYDSNLSSQHSAYRTLPFDTEFSIGVFVHITSAGVSNGAGATQNVYVQTTHPGAGLISPDPTVGIPTGNVTVVVNYSGDFVTGATVNIYNPGGTLVFTSGVAAAGKGPHTGYAATAWHPTQPGRYTATVNLSGPYGATGTGFVLNVIAVGSTVYVNSTSYQNQSLIHGLGQAATGTLLLVVGLVIGLAVALLMGRMMWAGKGPAGSPQPWSGSPGATPPKDKTMMNECPTCHQQFGSAAELADHAKKAHGDL